MAFAIAGIHKYNVVREKVHNRIESSNHIIYLQHSRWQSKSQCTGQPLLIEQIDVNWATAKKRLQKYQAHKQYVQHTAKQALNLRIDQTLIIQFSFLLCQ